MQVRITLRTGVHIHDWSEVKKAYPGLHKMLKSRVILPNPAYHEARRAGRRGYGIPREIHCFAIDRDGDDVLTLPLGILGEIIEATGGKVEIDDRRCQVPAPPMQSGVVLRDYQTPAVDALCHSLENTGLGLLEAPPGAGKTEMALEVIARLGQRTLWVTHTADLLRQARERAVSRLGLDPYSIGIIGCGRLEIGDVLTIGIIPTLRNVADAYAGEFGCVVLDECHHSPAETWSKVIGSFAARYRFGVTGSLERNDGLEKITHLFFGPTTYTIERSKGAGVLTPQLRVIKTSVEPPAWKAFVEMEARYKKAFEAYEAGKLKRKPKKPMMPYGKISDELLSDSTRNRLIVDTIARVAPGRHTLVLSSRIDHCELLASMLRERLGWIGPERAGWIRVIHGGQPQSLRHEIIERARAGDVKILLSVNIAKEGLDVPILDQLFLVAGGKDPIFLKQAIGRIQRLHPGKPRPVVWDVVDEECGVMKAQYWQRRRVYKELGMIASTRQQMTA